MSFMKWIGMGQPPKGAAEGVYGEDERHFGFENFGNTCYCNSVVQALYYCKPFRESVTNYPNGPVASINHVTPGASPLTSPAATSFGSVSLNSSNISTGSGNKEKKEDGPRPSAGRGGAPPKMESMKALAMTSEVAGPNVTISVPGMDETMYAALKDLFWKISSQKKKSGAIAPTAFINKLRKDNELFRSTMHQDAHEFLNYLLNTIADNIEDYQRKTMKDVEDRQNQNLQRQSVNGSLDSSSLPDSSSEHSASTQSNSLQSGQLHNPPPTTWVRQLFEGVLTNETRCLTCETVTSKDESFLDLSIDIEQNSSVTACLRQFSASEMLCHKNKFFCDVCSGLQEAEKRMKIKKLPNLLALHLKRFKYQEKLQRYIKLSYRVMFPMELRLFNTSDDAENSDRMYELWAIVVHIGGGPHHGHYISIIKNNGAWLCFDDDVVSVIEEDQITKYFGDNSGVGSGYVLFYQAVDFDLVSTGISTAPWDQAASTSVNINGVPEASSLPVYTNGTTSTASSTTESSQLSQTVSSSNTGQISRNPPPSSTPSHSRSASTSSRELLNGTTPTPSMTSNEEQPQPDPVIPPQKEEKEKKIRLPGFSRSTSSKDIGVASLLSKRPSLSAGMGILSAALENGDILSPSEEKKGFFGRSNTRKGKKEKEREKEKEKEKEALKMIVAGVET